MGFVTTQFHVEKLLRVSECKHCKKPIEAQLTHVRTDENTGQNRRIHRFHAACFRVMAHKELDDYRRYMEDSELDLIVGIGAKSKLFDAQRGIDKPL